MSVRSDARVIEHVAIDGERVHAVFSPGKGVPLLLCNDFVANLEILDDFAAALDRPVLCFDLPGIGTSADVGTFRRMPALAELVCGLLDHFEFRQPVDIMGIGWGGLLAQQFARSHGERTRRLILAATSSGQLMFPGRVASLLRLTRPGALATVVRNAAQARTLFGGRSDDECGRVAAAMARAIPPTRRGYAAQIYAVTGFTSLAWLARLNVPTLVIAGDDDAIVPMVNSRTLALVLPQAQLEIIRGGGHWFVLERTDEVVRVLADALDPEHTISAADQENMF
jgi:pimeloyl-ACP methyl ester carboxylesterase